MKRRNLDLLGNLMIQISKNVENDNINYLLKIIDTATEKSMTNLYLKCYLVEKSFRSIQYLNAHIDFLKRDSKNQNRKLILQILTNFFLKLNRIHFVENKQTTVNENVKTNVINWCIELMDNLKSENESQDQVKIRFYSFLIESKL